ncbi:MAG: aminotransferase class I/II-fold pyridoxal phosphate-dependent enzyme [Deltaproteobacteria bacterium]|nr:MAG: aminotransferase class I/II-fold pyridoxal phosphate-dependent enzyme [Deltaproteobacteria bacterium]
MVDGISLMKKVVSFEDAKFVKSQGIYPYFREISSAQDPVVIIDGREVVMLGSNSYLGLTTHPEVKKAAADAVEKYGTGCAGSRFLNGTLDIHVKLEEELAELVGKEAALVFSTGFQTNLGTISALVGKGEYVVTDKLDHASIIDGARLSFGRMLKFEHNDMDDLERILSRLPRERGKLVVVDGVFSMEGDIAKLPEIVDISERYGAAVMVDDAHGIGVLGRFGSGTSDHFGLTDRVHIIMGTFSKSLASLGGFVAADRDTIDYLKHRSRALIFSASMPPANVAAVRAALKIMKREPERIERLWENTRRMKEGLESLGFDTGKSETPIIPVRVGDTISTFTACMMLQEEGVFVNPVVPPAVPEGDCLIRVSLMATHTFDHIDFSLSKLEKVGRKLGVI